jgi:peptide/nickel transport system permease protein
MTSSTTSIPSRSYWHVVARQLRQEPVAMASAVLLLLIICAAVFAPWLAPADPFKASMLKRLLPIGSPGHWLGTDELSLIHI